MEHVSIMIKPASSECNMRCDYCFYCDEAANRSIGSHGMMNLETLETIIRKAMEHAQRRCTFGFQGGEPTLAGLDFFKTAVRLQKKYNARNLTVFNALQTNGMLLDQTWADFLARHRFLVGVSLDGYAGLHNLYRKDAKGEGTFDRVMRGIGALKQAGADFNILTVVTGETAKHIREVYSFLMAQGLSNQQYIPCLDPLGEPPGRRRYSLTVKSYARFLRELFEPWYEDRKAGTYVYIRQFENLAGILLGYPPESCDMNGVCSLQYAVEADGGVYPCDFYMLDTCRLGNIHTDSMNDIDKKRRQTRFEERSAVLPRACRDCRWLYLCRGGCYRRRNGSNGLYAYCEAIREVFPLIIPRLTALIAPQPSNGAPFRGHAITDRKTPPTSTDGI